MTMSQRPEDTGPAEYFYNAVEARKYHVNSRIVQIQTEMAARALELLALPGDGCPRLLLDVGCGSGISGGVLADAGHSWVGMDISEAMLRVAQRGDGDGGVDGSEDEDEDEGMDEGMDESVSSDQDQDLDAAPCLADLMLGDMGQGVCFRPGTFDGCISVSALQWLFHSNRAYEHPKRRIARLFTTLHSALTRSARAVLQFYPSNPGQIDALLAGASRAGFAGGVVVDYPNSTKARKYYLCLMTGGSGIAAPVPRGLTEASLVDAGMEMDEGGEEEEEQTQTPMANAQTVKVGPRQRQKLARIRKATKGREWVLKKKELYRRRGKDVKPDSKYTARKRRPRF